MSRIVFVGLCLAGIVSFLLSHPNDKKLKKVEHKIVKAEGQYIFK